MYPDPPYLPYSLSRCCSYSQDGNTWQSLPQTAQLPVIWPEVVAPLTDTVSFIHCYEPYALGGMQVLQLGGLVASQLRCDVQQLIVTLPCPTLHLQWWYQY